MNEFKEKVELMKESMSNAIEDNPALISSDLVDKENDELMDESFPQEISQPDSNQRNERGRRKRKDLRDKLESVIAENKAKDIQYQQAIAYIQEQERRLSEAQTKAEQNAHYSNVYYEQSLENDEQRVLTELKSAKEEGDIEKEISLQQRLADISAQKQVQLLSKALPKQQYQPMDHQNPIYYQDPSAYYPQTMQPQQQQYTNEYLEEFLEENPWADPNSSEYDQQLSHEVNEIASEINKNLKFNRATHVIGTQEYYSALGDLMRERYGNNVNNNQNEYMDNREYEVAPVNKRGSSMADRYITNKYPSNTQSSNRSMRPAIALTPDQKQIAKGLRSVLTDVYKRPFSVEEAEAEYYKQMMEDTQRKRMY